MLADGDPAELLNAEDKSALLPKVSELTGIPLERLEELKATRGTPTGDEVVKLLKMMHEDFDLEDLCQISGLRG